MVFVRCDVVGCDAVLGGVVRSMWCIVLVYAVVWCGVTWCSVCDVAWCGVVW